MKKLLLITFLSVIGAGMPVYSQQGFKLDTTPDCQKSVTKGAQNTLNEYAYKQYQFYLDEVSAAAKKRVEENNYKVGDALEQSNKSIDEYRIKYPELIPVHKILLKGDIRRKSTELIVFASVKHKCDLTNLRFPELPINYRY